MTSTLPTIQPHTTAKHHILRYYLSEWFPILGSAYRTLRFIDGFAGPGEYEGGEPGSPIIALRTIERHARFRHLAEAGNKVDFIFVEKDQDYSENLRGRVHERVWPKAFTTRVEHGEFEEVVTRLVDDVSRANPMPPTLAFIDPFGPAGFSMALLERLASFDRMEVLINLNYNEFVQWILPDTSKHVTANRLYGGPRWRPALDMIGRERSRFLVQEYEAALGEIGWRCTSFEMVNIQNQTAYHLVFGTRSPKGMRAMKQAMRTASPTGEFRYTDRLAPGQPVLPGLSIEREHAEMIGDWLFQKYEGQEVARDRIVADEIDWHRWWLERDLRKGLLHLEYGDDPRISGVRNGDGRRRIERSYPTGCFIRFGRPQQPRQTYDGPQQPHLL